MFKVIKWKASLRVADERKVAEVEFTSPLYVESIRDAIFLTLCICKRLYEAWTISGPFGYDDNKWELRGYTMNYAQGIESISFSVDNFPEADTAE